MRVRLTFAIALSMAIAVFAITGCGQSGSASSSADSSSATESTASVEASESSTASEAVFDQTVAEKEARMKAEASGRTVLKGTIELTTMATRASEIDSRLVKDFSRYDSNLVILILDNPVQLYARNGDGQGSRTSEATSVRLGENYGPWAAYEGKHVTVAVDPDNTWWPSDVSGALYSVTTETAQRIAPLTESDVASSDQDYVLPDSSSREYSEAELKAMDVHTLFLARNEIYARHNRQFVNKELQQYFGSKSWYSGTIAPSDFDEDVLNSTEKANVSRMLEVEKAKGSPYI